MIFSYRYSDVLIPSNEAKPRIWRSTSLETWVDSCPVFLSMGSPLLCFVGLLNQILIKSFDLLARCIAGVAAFKRSAYSHLAGAGLFGNLVLRHAALDQGLQHCFWSHRINLFVWVSVTIHNRIGKSKPCIRKCKQIQGGV